jgi:hypothetical protein
VQGASPQTGPGPPACARGGAERDLEETGPQQLEGPDGQDLGATIASGRNRHLTRDGLAREGIDDANLGRLAGWISQDRHHGVDVRRRGGPVDGCLRVRARRRIRNFDLETGGRQLPAQANQGLRGHRRRACGTEQEHGRRLGARPGIRQHTRQGGQTQDGGQDQPARREVRATSSRTLPVMRQGRSRKARAAAA